MDRVENAIKVPQLLRIMPANDLPVVAPQQGENCLPSTISRVDGGLLNWVKISCFFGF